MVKLSKRLKAIAEFIEPDSIFADIGSDHAYLPAYVCSQHETTRAIAGEVQKGPYDSAIRTVKKFQLDKQLEVRLGNGLEVIQQTDKVDTVIIAGMGGKLIRDILTAGLDKLQHIKRFILQPNTDAELVRRFLLEQHIPLLHEEILEEHGHIYEIIVGERESATFLYEDATEIEKQTLFGPLLMKQKSPAFRKKWQREYQHIQSIIEQLQSANQTETPAMNELLKKKSWMEEVIQ